MGKKQELDIFKKEIILSNRKIVELKQQIKEIAVNKLSIYKKMLILGMNPRDLKQKRGKKNGRRTRKNKKR